MTSVLNGDGKPGSFVGEKHQQRLRTGYLFSIRNSNEGERKTVSVPKNDRGCCNGSPFVITLVKIPYMFTLKQKIIIGIYFLAVLIMLVFLTPFKGYENISYGNIFTEHKPIKYSRLIKQLGMLTLAFVILSKFTSPKDKPNS